MQIKENLFEGYNLNNKLLSASLSALFVGKNIDLKIRGNKKELKAISEVFEATKNLHEEFHKEDTSIEAISLRLREKNEKAIEFEKILGICWPL